MATAALTSVASPRVPDAVGALSCLGGFSPRFPSSALPSPGRTTQPWSQTPLDPDLLHLSHSPDLAAKIMRKRQQEAQRNSARLTPRMQRIGLDIAALNTQVEEKRAVAAVQKGEDAGYVAAMELKEKMVNAAYANIDAKLKQNQKECIDFSLTNLCKDKRREWDLSDPDQVRRGRPARVEGEKCTISSMQMFESETMFSPEQKRENRQAQVDWLMAQMAEKKLREDAEKEKDRQYDEALSKANELRAACEMAAAQEHRAEVIQHANANQELAMVHSARRDNARLKDAAAAKDHAAFVSEHNLMRERHDYSLGLDGRKRDYKRCSYEQEQKVWDTNRASVQARLDDKKAHANDDEGYHNLGKALDCLGMTYEAAWDRMNCRRRRDIDKTNDLLAQEKKERDVKERIEYRSFANP